MAQIRFKNDGIDESPEMLALLLKNFKGTKQVELEEVRSEKSQKILYASSYLSSQGRFAL
jgi:hypothetical protein